MGKKRGRPTVAAKHLKEGGDIMIKSFYPDITTRARANKVYELIGYNIIKEAASEIPHYELIIPQEKRSKDGILGQIGRMERQDRYNHESIIYVARLAAQYLYEGCSAKEVEREIRRIRLEN